MKNSYPTVLTPDDGGYVVFIPDFNVNTQGDTLSLVDVDFTRYRREYDSRSVML